jgi:hypothetical protein
MTFFDQRGQTVTYQYNAAGNINFGAVQNKMELVTELEKLKGELPEAVRGHVIDEEKASDVGYQITKAIEQTQKPEPNKKTLEDRLSQAKTLLEGITAASGMVAALVEASQLVQKLF